MKKPYEIIENVDGTLTLRVADISKTFRTAKALNSFAMQLYEQVQTRQTGMFRLQDAKDGRLNMIFNKGSERVPIQQTDAFLPDGFKIGMKISNTLDLLDLLDEDNIVFYFSDPSRAILLKNESPKLQNVTLLQMPMLVGQ